MSFHVSGKNLQNPPSGLLIAARRHMSF